MQNLIDSDPETAEIAQSQAQEQGDQPKSKRLTLITADTDLLRAAQTAGLLVDNPNLHP